MKLARIEHYRCDEVDATTYVWVNDEMVQDVVLAYRPKSKQPKPRKRKKAAKRA